MGDYELCYEDEENWEEPEVVVIVNRQKDHGDVLSVKCQHPPQAITRQSSISQSRLLRLPPDVLFRILQFIPQRCTLTTLITTANYFQHLLYSPSAEHLWNETQEFRFCIDSYCPTCSFVKRKKQCCSSSVLSLLEKCPIHKVKLHCFITDLPSLLLSLAKPGCLRALDLTLTNKSNSPPLEDLLADVALDLASLSLDSVMNARGVSGTATSFTYGSNDNNKDKDIHRTALMSVSDDSFQRRFRPSTSPKPSLAYFPALTELSLDSSHLQHVNPLGRATLLDILGRHLESLSFSGLSPPGVFAILSSRCPRLLRLRVDRASSEQDLSTFHSPTIQELELCRANFLLLPGSLCGLPALRKLHYTPSFRCDSAQMESIIGAAPQTLESISLEVSSQCVNPVLRAISRRLHMVRTVSIQGAHEVGCLSEEAVTCLGRQCVFLSSLDIGSAKSVSDLAFDQSAFAVLASFPSLTTLRVKYDEATVGALVSLLLQSDSLRLGGSVALWERKKWIPPEKWAVMTRAVGEFRRRFPTCNVVLEATI